MDNAVVLERAGLPPPVHDYLADAADSLQNFADVSGRALAQGFTPPLMISERHVSVRSLHQLNPYAAHPWNSFPYPSIYISSLSASLSSITPLPLLVFNPSPSLVALSISPSLSPSLARSFSLSLFLPLSLTPFSPFFSSLTNDHLSLPIPQRCAVLFLQGQQTYQVKSICCSVSFPRKSPFRLLSRGRMNSTATKCDSSGVLVCHDKSPS